MNALPPLLADGLEDVLGFVVFVVVAIVIWAIQVFGKFVQKGRPQRPQGPRQPRPAQGGGLEDEIGDFLRKAARRRQQPQQAPPPAARQRPAEEPVRAEVVGGRRPDRAEVLREQARQAARRQAKARQVAAGPPQYGSQPSEGLRRAKQREAPQPLTIAPRTERTDETPRIELASVFAAAKPEATFAGSAAAGLYAALADPGNLRQAIVLTEIINRPEDRW